MHSHHPAVHEPATLAKQLDSALRAVQYSRGLKATITTRGVLNDNRRTGALAEVTLGSGRDATKGSLLLLPEEKKFTAFVRGNGTDIGYLFEAAARLSAQDKGASSLKIVSLLGGTDSSIRDRSYEAFITAAQSLAKRPGVDPNTIHVDHNSVTYRALSTLPRPRSTRP